MHYQLPYAAAISKTPDCDRNESVWVVSYRFKKVP